MEFYIWKVVSLHFAISLHPHNTILFVIFYKEGILWGEGHACVRKKEKINKYWGKDSGFMGANLTHISTLCVISEPKTSTWDVMTMDVLLRAIWPNSRNPNCLRHHTDRSSWEAGSWNPPAEQRLGAVCTLKDWTIVICVHQKGEEADSSEYQLISCYFLMLSLALREPNTVSKLRVLI